MSKLHTKLAHIQGELGVISKNGKNNAQGYSFANEQAFLDVLRPLTSASNVSMTISSQMKDYREFVKPDGKVTYIATCDCVLTLTDGESGEQIVSTSSGVGHDTGDKAIYKAITGCAKYSLWKTFALATGDDPENDSAKPTFTKKTKGGLV